MPKPPETVAFSLEFAMGLTQTQKGFALDVFSEVPPGQAYMAHYKVRTMASADACASRLLKSAKVQAYLQELLQKVEEEAISTEKERRKILTQIERATVADFVDEHGNLSVADRDRLNTAAIAELKTERTLAGIKTTLKLRDPVGAITEHNKMDKIYDTSTNVNIDNRQIHIIVRSEETRKRLENIGERLLRQRHGNSQ